MATLSKGHLPFLDGVYRLVSSHRTFFIRITRDPWVPLAAERCMALLDFRASTVLRGSWLFTKCVALDVAQYITFQGRVYFHVGMFASCRGYAFDCLAWVATRQVARLYGAWVLILFAPRQQYSQITMLQGNMQAMWETLNLRSRSRYWKHACVLCRMAHQLRRSRVILHFVDVPTGIQLVHPMSHVQHRLLGSIEEATWSAKAIFDKGLAHLCRLEQPHKGLVHLS